ncbi:MAG: hypothetical protein PHF86_13330 [Candidatus Nanoarchaeia archaeon]|jgi:uncharacterized membrane protein YeiB|nr:hypothetical protein [Candidatus Nanoarchaeia archaeon]
MTTEIFLLILCTIAIILLIIFRKTAFVKKNWRYALILIPAVLVLVLKILATIRSKGTASTSSNATTLKDDITSIKGKLEEVNSVVKVEAAIEKTKNEQLMNELKEVQKIPDDRERRKRLAEMVG